MSISGKAAFGVPPPPETASIKLKEEGVIGNDWTIADYTPGHIEMFVDALPVDWSRFPNLIAFYERIRSNPYWAATATNSPEEIGRVPHA